MFRANCLAGGLGAKLGLGFAALTLIGVLLGGYALNRMAAISRQTNLLRADYIPSLAAVSDLATTLDDLRITQARYVASGRDDAVRERL